MKVIIGNVEIEAAKVDFMGERATVYGAGESVWQGVEWRGIDWAAVTIPVVNITAERRRAARQEIFAVMDKYQLALVYSGLTDVQRTGLAIYRQAMLDWPEEPEDVPVPVAPEWMV